MKKITLLLTTLVFSLTMMFASTSYAEWTEVSEGVDGDTYYVDFERIRKHGGYVYFWYLIDLPLLTIKDSTVLYTTVIIF